VLQVQRFDTPKPSSFVDKLVDLSTSCSIHVNIFSTFFPRMHGFR